MEGVAYGEECDALCPDGTALGSVEGTVAFVLDGLTSDIEVDYSYPHCAYAADVEAWQAEKCPGCVVWTGPRVDPHQPYPESCAHDYDWMAVTCDITK